MVAKKSISRIFSVLFVFIFMLSVMPLQVAHAAVVRHAKSAASGTGNCLSWANACTLQTALTGAASGDEIWAAAGTHKPTTVGTGRSATFQLKNGVALYGGFVGTEMERSERNPATRVTILSGDIDNNDSQTPIISDLKTVTGNTTNSYHIVTGATGATLDGFTITAGYANGGCYLGCGGGMINLYSSPTLTNVIFSGNSAYFAGGGMFNGNSSPTLTNVTFSGNSTSNYGGGMYNDTSSPMLTNVTFSGNTASLAGGGMYVSNSSPTLTNVTFSGNSAPNNGGGGMLVYIGSPTLTNVTFSGNSAGVGGGLYHQAGNSQIRNTIFWGNTAAGGGAQIDGSPSVSDSIVQGGYAGGTHIIPADPKLGTLGNYGGFTQTIPLLVGSSAIDATSSNCPTTDQRGVVRSTLNCDIGAYEFADTTKPVVNTFTVPTLSTNLNIPITAFTATDDLAVTGYLITTSFAPPAAGAAGWIDTVPATCAVLSDGPYTLYPWAKDAAGNVSAVFAPPPAVVVDTTAPDTQIDSHPANPVNSADASFTFSSADGTATFECSLEGGAFAACTNPKNYTGLAAGSHTFAVRAKDPAANVDATPASYTWVIDLTAPTVLSSLRAGPNPTSAASVNFTVTFSESVTGVDVSDFSLTKTGVSGATVSGVSGSGSVYTVTVNTAPLVSGIGTIRLDVLDNNSIVDAASNPLGGVGLSDGSYTLGETYDVRFYRAYIPLVLKY